MHAGNPILDTMNVQAALGQLDLLPLQVADLRGSQTVPIGDQDHRGVAMSVAAMLACAVHQATDLASRLFCTVKIERRLCFMVGGETRYQHQPSMMHLRFLGMHPPDSAGRD
jgi:hypothetical protein